MLLTIEILVILTGCFKYIKNNYGIWKIDNIKVNDDQIFPVLLIGIYKGETCFLTVDSQQISNDIVYVFL